MAAQTGADRVRRLVARAHDQCFIANTLATEVVVDPVVVEQRSSA